MRILLVEDEEQVSRFITRGLEAERFAVDSVYDGTKGLEYATTYSYDRIILDLMLPGLSRTEILQRIRRLLSVIALSVCFLPALRASRTDPVAALKTQ